MDKTLSSNITVNGDLTANNLLTMSHTNSFDDLDNTPSLYDSNNFKIVTYSVSYTSGTNDYSAVTNGTSSSSSYDRCVWKEIELDGWYAVGIMGYWVDSDFINLYCVDICRAGEKYQAMNPEVKCTKDSVQIQSANMNGSSVTAKVEWSVLYRKK